MHVFWEVTAPKPYIPHKKSRTKGTSLGCQPAPRNDFYHKKLCCLSCLQITSTPPKIPLPGTVFWGFQNAYAVIRKFLMDVCSSIPIHVCFKNGQNRCRINVQKAAGYWWHKKPKHVLMLKQNPWGNFSFHCYASLYCGSTVTLQVLSKSVQVWGAITKNPSTTLQSKCSVVLWAYNNRKLSTQCCHLGSYFKHTSFSCRYIHMDIMCNIRTARSSPEHPLPATGIPMCQAQGCVSASLNLHHQDQPGGNVEQPQLMCKYDIIHKTRNTYHNISLCCLRRTEPRPWVTCTKNLVKIECMVPKIWSRPDKQTHTCRLASQYSAPLLGAK